MLNMPFKITKPGITNIVIFIGAAVNLLVIAAILTFYFFGR